MSFLASIHHFSGAAAGFILIIGLISVTAILFATRPKS